MANEQNLRPFAERTESEQREIRSKGGIKSGEARRKRKLIRDALRAVLDEKASEGSDMTRLEVIAADAVRDMHKSPSVKKLKILAEILGELEQNINLTRQDDFPEGMTKQEAIDFLARMNK